MRAMVVPVSLVLLLPLTACGSDEESPSGSEGGGGGSTVDVTLQEFAVSTSQTSAPAGDVTFDVTNDGPNDTHEFVVIKTGLGPTELPTDKTGAVDEEGEGIEPVDEIEDIEVGDSQSLTTNLDAGTYVLICNIYDEKEQESHYQEGMRTSFTVE
jgi:uncharacterized cupredoxin-like copper-binding protein